MYLSLLLFSGKKRLIGSLLLRRLLGMTASRSHELLPYISFHIKDLIVLRSLLLYEFIA